MSGTNPNLNLEILQVTPKQLIQVCEQPVNPAWRSGLHCHSHGNQGKLTMKGIKTLKTNRGVPGLAFVLSTLGVFKWHFLHFQLVHSKYLPFFF